jgi:hypothetical protein
VKNYFCILPIDAIRPMTGRGVKLSPTRADTYWRGIEPKQSAVKWLRQGMTNAA